MSRDLRYFDRDLKRIVVARTLIRSLDRGGVRINLISFPEKITSFETARELCREQAEALRSLADSLDKAISMKIPTPPIFVRTGKKVNKPNGKKSQ